MMKLSGYDIQDGFMWQLMLHVYAIVKFICQRLLGKKYENECAKFTVLPLYVCKGTPQGGVLSPLMSLLVINEILVSFE